MIFTTPAGWNSHYRYSSKPIAPRWGAQSFHNTFFYRYMPPLGAEIIILHACLTPVCRQVDQAGFQVRKKASGRLSDDR